MYHLIYASTATRAFTELQLNDLLTKFRLNNIKLNITGMLIYTGGHFLQVLEGEEKVVKKLYDAIRKDKRHKDFIIIHQGELPERQFGNSVMGFRVLRGEPLFTDAELASDNNGTLKIIIDYLEFMF